MIMVQKQPAFSLSSPMFHHRRNPSAPPAVVVVQPTRTPGLLSLSKPPPQRSLRNQRPAPKPSIQRNHLPNLTTAPATPTPAPRGRQPKDKAPSSRGKSPHHQSSPSSPKIKASQAEGPTTTTNSDPFLVPSSPTSPTLSTRPSGKLARRRQQQKQQQPAPPHTPPAKQNPKPVSIPFSPQPKPSKQLSLSAPPSRQRPSKREPRSNTAALLRDFPVCDDMTEVGDVSDTDVPPSPPRTPTRPRTRNSTKSAQGSDSYASPPTYTRGASAPAFTPTAVLSAAGKGAGIPARSHRRAPSEGGVFTMSSDEGSAGEELSFSTFSRPVDTQAFLDSLARNSQHRQRAAGNSRGSKAGVQSHSSTVGLSSSVPHMSTLGVHTPARERERQLEAQAQAQQAGYFASSSFQNSPSPEDLPDPLLI